MTPSYGLASMVIVGVLSLLDMWFLVRTYDHIFNGVIGRRNVLSIFWISLVLGACIVMGMQDMVAFGYLIVILSFLLLFCYQGHWQKKLFYAVSLIVIDIYWELIWDFITFFIPPYNKRFAWLFISVMLVERLIWWLLLWLVRRMGSNENKPIPMVLWSFFMLLPAASFFVLFVVTVLSASMSVPVWMLINIPFLTLFMLLNVLLILFYKKVSGLLSEAEEKGQLEQQLKMQQKHYRELADLYEDIHQVRHDMNNHLNTIVRLVSVEANHGEINAYLQEIRQQAEALKQVVDTKNPALDTILNMKLDECRKSGIRVETEIYVPPEMKISFNQIVTILGNLLDNAREASQKLNEDRRYVKVVLRYMEHSLFLQVVNSCDGSVQWKNGRPLTNKSQFGIHGLGLKNVQAEVQKTGSMELKCSEDLFEARIILYDV